MLYVNIKCNDATLSQFPLMIDSVHLLFVVFICNKNNVQRHKRINLPARNMPEILLIHRIHKYHYLLIVIFTVPPVVHISAE